MEGSVFTVGHSNHPFEVFLDLLKSYEIDAVADTRSYPRSKFSPQYDAEPLARELERNGITYLFFGKELGGRPDDLEFYDADGRVLYGRVAESAFFRQGLIRLREEMQCRRLAILCSEENPSVCHRRLLIGRVLRQQGAAVSHIRGNGMVQLEDDLAAAEASADSQLTLFDHTLASEWKSIPSVLQKRRQSGSSVS